MNVQYLIALEIILRFIQKQYWIELRIYIEEERNRIYKKDNQTLDLIEDGAKNLLDFIQELLKKKHDINIRKLLRENGYDDLEENLSDLSGSDDEVSSLKNVAIKKIEKKFVKNLIRKVEKKMIKQVEKKALIMVGKKTAKGVAKKVGLSFVPVLGPFLAVADTVSTVYDVVSTVKDIKDSFDLIGNVNKIEDLIKKEQKKIFENIKCGSIESLTRCEKYIKKFQTILHEQENDLTTQLKDLKERLKQQLIHIKNDVCYKKSTLFLKYVYFYYVEICIQNLYNDKDFFEFISKHTDETIENLAKHKTELFNEYISYLSLLDELYINIAREMKFG
ncbi:hypothetical protein SLOPH_2582 [Spraguea lophii 42_110]|uniref:Uncharacterized protein n=1 Tax=Spraguea lophii (strain 42_110) TaxID=1358809 RepID=S7XR52_SPRLO|nr:hypothetical protein SLOPH_2582 [Spraguea lophii 42_110]